MAKHSMPADAYDAQRIAYEMRSEGQTAAAIVARLNRELEGTYTERNRTIYRRHDFDYLPDIHILEVGK